MNIRSLFVVDKSSERLSAMEGLRAYAALIVYVLHLIGSFMASRLDINFAQITVVELAESNLNLVPAYWLWSSHYGVDLFFLLSGYLIWGMIKKEGFEYSRFIFHRFLRIYPTLIISTIIYVAYLVLIKGDDFWLVGIIGNLLLLNGVPGYEFQDINIVTWSLFFEFAFYFSFPILWWLSGKKVTVFSIMTIAAILVLSIISSSYIRFLMFLAGVLLKEYSGKLTSKENVFSNELFVIAIYLVSTSVYVFTRNSFIFIPLYFLTSILFVHKVLNVKGALSCLFSNQIMRYLGNISFSFYIFHPLGLMLSRDALVLLDISNNNVYFLFYFLFSFVISLFLSMLCFVFIEKQYFKNKRKFDGYFDSFFVTIRKGYKIETKD